MHGFLDTGYPRFRSGQRKAFLDETANIYVLHAAIKNYADPVLFVHVVGGNEAGLGEQ